MKNEANSGIEHNIFLYGKKQLVISGVNDVDNFNDKVLLIYTPLGELTVRGRNLRVDSFGGNGKELTATGDIRALIYGDADKKSKIGFLKKLFR